MRDCWRDFSPFRGHQGNSIYGGIWGGGVQVRSQAVGRGYDKFRSGIVDFFLSRLEI